MSLPLKLAKANEKTLREILREAESFLSNQFKAAIAADQRALAFAGALSAGTVILFGASVAVFTAPDGIRSLGIIGIVTALSLLRAIFLAVRSAMPGTFYYTGNIPSKWIEDIAKQKTFRKSLAEQAAHYDEEINKNSKILECNGKQMQRAIWWAFRTLGVGAGITIIFLLFWF